MGFEVYGTKFAIDPKYTFIKALGKGAYGVVCSVKDSDTGRMIAIKKIQSVAKSVYDAKHTLREVRLLRHCGKHPNIITLLDLIMNVDTDELYIGMECMDTDLHRIIQSSQKLSSSHHKHFMFQLMLGVDFLHRNGILHRDLKPANLLVSKNCDLRISDFGLARRAPAGDNSESLMTEHVVTRWYRAPELMLCPDGKYTSAVDVWSCGCIFAELLGRTPLFPGNNFVHQLQLIFDVIGTPHFSETAFIKNRQASEFLRGLPIKKNVELASIYPNAEEQAIGFMSRCIRFSAENRISVSDALVHSFFADAPLRDKEILVPELNFSAFNFEKQNLNEKELRQLIIDEVADFNAQLEMNRIGAVVSEIDFNDQYSTLPQKQNEKTCHFKPQQNFLYNEQKHKIESSEETSLGTHKPKVRKEEKQYEPGRLRKKSRSLNEKAIPSVSGQCFSCMSNYNRGSLQTVVRPQSSYQPKHFRRSFHGSKIESRKNAIQSNARSIQQDANIDIQRKCFQHSLRFQSHTMEHNKVHDYDKTITQNLFPSKTSNQIVLCNSGGHDGPIYEMVQDIENPTVFIKTSNGHRKGTRSFSSPKMKASCYVKESSKPFIMSPSKSPSAPEYFRKNSNNLNSIGSEIRSLINGSSLDGSGIDIVSGNSQIWKDDMPVFCKPETPSLHNAQPFEDCNSGDISPMFFVKTVFSRSERPNKIPVFASEVPVQHQKSQPSTIYG